MTDETTLPTAEQVADQASTASAGLTSTEQISPAQIPSIADVWLDVQALAARLDALIVALTPYYRGLLP